MRVIEKSVNNQLVNNQLPSVQNAFAVLRDYFGDIPECQWDILCAVERKDHTKSGSFIQHNGYHVCYAGVIGGLYSGVILIVKDTLQPVVVQSDIHGRYIVVEINYEGQRIWIVGIYAPNEVSQRIALWQRLNEVLSNGYP